MKNKKYHTFGKIPYCRKSTILSEKFQNPIVKTCKIDTLTYIYDCLLSWLGTGISMKKWRAKEDLLAQLPCDHDHDGPTISNHTWNKMSILFVHQSTLFIKV